MVGPAWSPKTNEIVIPVYDGSLFTLAAINLADQRETKIASKRWSWIERLVWLRDGSGLVVIAREQKASPVQIWFVSYPGGESKRITIDLNDYSSVTVTEDSKSLVTVESDQVSNVWVVPSDAVRKGVQITDTRFDGTEGISWTPDGRVVYASRANDTFDLWIVGADGTGKKQLTANVGNNRRPFVSADGRYIVFVSDRTGNDHIWRMDIDGTNARQLTNGPGERHPQASPDNQWVLYLLTAGRTGLWRVSIEGGEGQRLVDKPTRGLSISPDGKWIATSYFESAAIKTGIYPFAGGEPSKILDFEAVIVRWTLDGSELTYVDLRGNPSVIESQPIAGGPTRQLMDFSPDRVFYFVWSNDAKYLAVARGSLSQDVVLISNLKDQR
jgi:Tol biopolymer transport system component